MARSRYLWIFVSVLLYRGIVVSLYRCIVVSFLLYRTEYGEGIDLLIGAGYCASKHSHAAPGLKLSQWACRYEMMNDDEGKITTALIIGGLGIVF